MLVALGEAGILSLEDLAGCATDDLIGWSERKDGDVINHAGAFSELDVSGPEAEAVIMAARLAAGWIEPLPEIEETEIGEAETASGREED
jgi:N utilization substance protein A